jgi:DNA-binding beta-propeller fold protein YncE
VPERSGSAKDGSPAALREARIIEIPDAAGTLFDHGAFDPKSRRVFVAHTARDRVEVIDHDDARHVASLPGFPEAAGVVAEDGHVLVTNRGAAELAWLDARTLGTRALAKTGPRPNGVAIVARRHLAVVACIGDGAHGPELQVLDLAGGQRWSAALPGRPRWCVTDAEGARVFLAIQAPSMVWVARLPDLGAVERWALPAEGAHGIDIDHANGRLYVACDGRALIEVGSGSGELRRSWVLAGGPDATFFNPASGLVHVAIGDPGLVQSFDTRTGARGDFTTAPGAKTTALIPPNGLYVFSPTHHGALALVENTGEEKLD